jgi:hypothetical protein
MFSQRGIDIQVCEMSALLGGGTLVRHHLRDFEFEAGTLGSAFETFEYILLQSL